MKMIRGDDYRKLQHLVYNLVRIIEKQEDPELEHIKNLEDQVDDFVPMDVQLEFMVEEQQAASCV